MRKFYILTGLLLVSSISAVYAQWTKKSSPEVYYPLFHITSHGGKLYVAGNHGVYSSSDNGTTWDSLTNGYAASSTSSNREIVFAGSHIYVRSTTEAVFRSADGGNTWSHDTVGLKCGTSYGQNDVVSMYYDSATSRVYASKAFPSYGLYYKTPSDTSWTIINSNNIGTSAAIVWGMIKTANGIYAATSSGVFESTDGGNTFAKKTSTGYPNPTGSPNLGGNPLLAIGTDIYFIHTGIYKSTDNGITWSRTDNNFSKYNYSLNWVWVSALHYDGANLYAGVNSNGNPDSTYVSSNAGLSWNLMNGAQPSSHLTSMVSHNGTLYATAFSMDSIWVYSGASSIEEEKSKNVSIYPNPATDQFTLTSSLQRISGVKMINCLGQTVADIKPLLANRIQINTCNLENGIYFIQLNYEDKIITSKVVVKHY